MSRVLCIAGFLSLIALQAEGAITLAVHKIAKDLTGAESTALSTAGYNSSAGNLIAVWTVSYSGAQPVGSVTDSAGDTFTPLTQNKGTWYGQWFYAKDVKGETFNVVTIHPAITGRATLIYPGMNVMEFSGVDKASPLDLDLAGPKGALDSVWESASFNASPGELVLTGIVTANGGAFTAGPGFKLEDVYQTTSSSKFSFGAMDQVVSEAQTGLTAKVMWKGTLQATGSVVSFKPAAGS
jgi:hypothetical protein